MPTDRPLNVAVYGAGAVGCYYGALLARAGHQVTVIGRPEHVQAINAQGLRLQSRDFDINVAVQATTKPVGVLDAELILLAVKSPDTERAGQQMHPHLAPGAVIICLQNGVDNAERLRAVLPGFKVSSAVVYVASEMAGPGHVRHHGRGELVIERAAMPERVGQAFRAAGIAAIMDENVRGALWAKLILNCAYNALSAAGHMAYGDLIRQPGVEDVMEAVVAECEAVAAADGVAIPGDIRLAVRRIAETMPRQHSSTAQDLMRGRPSEIDYLNGHIARRGKALGIATPANTALWVTTRLAETWQTGQANAASS